MEKAIDIAQLPIHAILVLAVMAQAYYIRELTSKMENILDRLLDKELGTEKSAPVK